MFRVQLKAKIYFCVLGFSFIIHGSMAHADSRNRFTERGAERASQQSEDTEYNFNWLDPDKQIYVLQNRKYTKALHPMLSLMGGIGFSNPYSSSYNIEPRFSFFLSEAFAIELFYTMTSNQRNSTYEALTGAAGVSVIPTVRDITSQYGLSVQYIPWYAKINVFNAILYFDWYFNLGLGQIQSQIDTRTMVTAPSILVQQNHFGIFAGTGQYFHLSTHWKIRFDLTGSFYQASTRGTTGDQSWFTNYNVGLGLAWLP